MLGLTEVLLMFISFLMSSKSDHRKLSKRLISKKANKRINSLLKNNYAMFLKVSNKKTVIVTYGYIQGAAVGEKVSL